MKYDQMTAGFIVGFTVSQIVCHRGLALKFLATLALVLASDAAAAQQTTFRDSSGRTIGTAATDSQGRVTYRDAGGRTTGTSSTDSQGNTTFRDAGGRTTGTMQGRR